MKWQLPVNSLLNFHFCLENVVSKPESANTHTIHEKIRLRQYIFMCLVEVDYIIWVNAVINFKYILSEQISVAVPRLQKM